MEIARAVCDDNGERFIDAPDKFDFHEYRHMERFIETVEDGETAEALWRAIKGRGAFRCFNDTADRLGLLDRWFRYRDEAMKEFVIAWAKETSIGQDIVICQKDVRNIQLAKAALYAGGKIMMRRLGIDRLDKVILAGAFGSYIDKESAACLAIFPDCDLDKVYSVGNAAGDGARIGLLNIDKREEADRIARQVEHIELTLEPDFEKIFGQSMWLPRMKDEFPHLKHLPPAKPKMHIPKNYA